MDEEIEKKIAAAMVIYGTLPPEEQEKVEEYMKFMLYFKEMSDNLSKITPDYIEESETFATINKHLRAIIRELKNLEDKDG